jgi:hypothetical protein
VPITYKIDADKRTIRTKCFGHVTLPEVINHFRTVAQDPETPKRRNVFLDLSELDSNSLPDSGELSTVVNELKRISGEPRLGACAILATNDALFGMMRMFEVLSERLFRVIQTFRTAEDAEAWLVSHQFTAD